MINTPTDEQLWAHYNGLLLSPDLDRVRKLLARYDLFRQAVDVPGDIVECGVFKGAGLAYWAKLLRIYAPNSPKRVVGFDTFAGYGDTCLEYETDRRDAFLAEAGSNGQEIDVMAAALESFELGDKVELVAGDIASAAPEYVQTNPGFRISLLNVDLDTYSGTLAALAALYPVVARGGVIVMDEYGQRGWGESDAVDEFFAEIPGAKIKAVRDSASPTAYVVKP